MEAMAVRPLYVWSGEDRAVVLERSLIAGNLAPRFSRCTVYCDTKNERAFLPPLLEFLRELRIAYTRIGDTMWGCNAALLATGISTRPRHTIVLDLSLSEKGLMEQMNGSERKIRKALKEDIRSRRIESRLEIDRYFELSRETSERVRAREAYTVYPKRFFEILFDRMGRQGAAAFFLSEFEEQPLAAHVFLTVGDRFLYFHGASTRDRGLTNKQGSASNFWSAILLAKERGFREFDLGGCTVTNDRAAHGYGVYNFKRKWGGRLETFYVIEQVNSRFEYAIQKHILSPLWDRLHPLIFKIKGLRSQRRV
jgi:lipid II:glycine glycyltransferase (peptidoglycan interpeptide bridge formation enzyme)